MPAPDARSWSPDAARASYDPLSSSEWGGGKHIPLSLRASRVLMRRRTAIIAIAVFVTVLVGLSLVTFHEDIPWTASEKLPEPLPPLYPEYHQAELALPQHDVRRPFEGGRKYMWVSDHTQCKSWLKSSQSPSLTYCIASGFGNFMQDMIMNAQLVYESGRSYASPGFAPHIVTQKTL